MGDLTPYVTAESETVKRIYAHHKAVGDAEPERGYLGASIIGHECDRFLWLTFRGCVPREFSGRLYRLFETGDLEEARFVKELRAIGCTVHDLDENGEQFEVLALGGHFSGHMDAAIQGVPEAPKAWHVGEFKTHKAKLFAKLEKAGVKESYPKHWAQMQAYMGLTGMKRALYLARNKDTDHLYSERVKFDATAFKNLMERAARTIRTSEPPLRMASRPDDWRCKFCDAYTLCWGVGRDGIEPDVAVPVPAKSCKNCLHSTAETEREGAQWSCASYGIDLESADMGVGCPAHLVLPGLVPFAEPTDSQGDWVEYTNTDGTKWRNGPGGECFSTEGLISGRGPLDGAKLPIAQGLKHVPWSCDPESNGDYDCTRPYCERHHGCLFLCAVCGQGEAELEAECPGVPPGLTVDFGDLPLVARYPWDDSERLWDGPASELADVLGRTAGAPPEVLSAMEPHDTQEDAEVSAAEYRLPGGDVLIVRYKAGDTAAIWRGKS